MGGGTHMHACTQRGDMQSKEQQGSLGSGMKTETQSANKNVPSETATMWP